MFVTFFLPVDFEGTLYNSVANSYKTINNGTGTNQRIL